MFDDGSMKGGKYNGRMLMAAQLSWDDCSFEICMGIHTGSLYTPNMPVSTATTGGLQMTAGDLQ